MISTTSPCSASSQTLDFPSSVASSDGAFVVSLESKFVRHYYKVEDIRQSETAWVLFARHTVTKKTIVMKILRAYKDTRFGLETVSERQKCQLEAVYWNRVFSPGVHLGLARIYELDLIRKSVSVGDIIRQPTSEMLEATAEYALLMQRLPEEWRLDYLLDRENDLSCWNYLQPLIKYVAYMHSHLAVPLTNSEDGVLWGSFEQLQEKLIQNLAFLDMALKTNKNSIYRPYRTWLCSLKETLPGLLRQSLYPQYFEQRVAQGCIKRCHGDLKTSHIWIVPYNHPYHGKDRENVWLLDAIDFNPIFSNIDILSDLALLVTDICVRMKSFSLAHNMIKEYLRLTKQQDEVSRAVLTYYLTEKALISAAVSIVDDNLPGLSLEFLQTAKMYMRDLEQRVVRQH